MNPPEPISPAQDRGANFRLRGRLLRAPVSCGGRCRQWGRLQAVGAAFSCGDSLKMWGRSGEGAAFSCGAPQAPSLTARSEDRDRSTRNDPTIVGFDLDRDGASAEHVAGRFERMPARHGLGSILRLRSLEQGRPLAGARGPVTSADVVHADSRNLIACERCLPGDAGEGLAAHAAR